MILGKNLSELIFGSTSITKEASLDNKNIAQGLEKVSSLPLNPETYPALMGMLKIASQAITKMDTEIKDFEKKAEVRIIVDDLIENGLTDAYDVEEKVSSLLTKSAEELVTVKEAIKLSSVIVKGELFEGLDKTASDNRRKNMFDGIL